MGFLTSSILSGVAWDSIKRFGKVSIDKLKEGLKEWILDEQSYETIVNKINSAPEIIKKTEGLLKEYIDSEEVIKKILTNAKSTNSLIQSGNTYENSLNQQGNRNTMINNGSQFNINNPSGGQFAHSITNINKKGEQPKK